MEATENPTTPEPAADAERQAASLSGEAAEAGRGGAAGAAARRALLRTAALAGLSVGGVVTVLSMTGGGPTTVAG
ncbi:hypothetical protein [Streptomyces sp. NPDC050560]|uniref:hypothetical protein n=1 Tax=Streptomyces sp. NPDC050560 TaxID=3365630 RepID=UPI0037ADE313